MTENVIIIGGGPAGLAASIYNARAGLNPLVIAGSPPGGQLTLTSEVENYPGFESILGPELVMRMRKHAEKFGVRFIDQNVVKVDLSKKPFEIYLPETSSASKFFDTVGTPNPKSAKNLMPSPVLAKSIIITTGAKALWLGLESEQRLRGKGVSACATCLPTGSNIIANSSPQAIDKVVIKQKVLTHQGSFEPVAETGNRHFKGKLVKITSRYFREENTLLTPEHPVLVAALKKGTGINYWKQTWTEPEWVPAGSLNTRHILLYPIVKETKDVKILKLSEILKLPYDAAGLAHYPQETATSRRIPNSIPINKDFMRLAGYFLAEGCITNRGFNLYFGPKDLAYVQDVSDIIENLFKYQVKVKKVNSVYRVECYAGILRDLFEKMFGKYSYGKSIPHWFIYLPLDKQAELIKGYWRGDGGLKEQGFGLVTNSSKLVAQFKIVLLRLGIIPQISRQSKSQLNKNKHYFQGREIVFKHDRYQLLLGGSWLERASNIIGVSHPLLQKRTRSNNHGWIKKGYAYLPVARLENVSYEGLVHNIAVKKDNSYVTANAIVHNCDGFFFRDKIVAVIGGGDTAMEESLTLTKFAKKVYIIHRRDSFRASKIMQERVLKNPKIEIIWNNAVEKILGETKVTGIKIKDLSSNIKDLNLDGVFVAIGHKPDTDIFKGKIELDKKGYIVVSDYMTSVKGVFAAGDCVDHKYRQAATAVGMGVAAALEVEKFLEAR